MRAVIQRVASASVTIGGEKFSGIGHGLVVLLGIAESDTGEDIEWLAGKVAALRLFADETGAWNRSVAEDGGQVLVVSQFTLFASTKKGTKPSWHRAAKPAAAGPLCDAFVQRLASLLPGRVCAGRFGAMMSVSLENDGPVTLWLDTQRRERPDTPRESAQ
jgi:D-tyrosyl-tRNA(Tyr) deacylase